MPEVVEYAKTLHNVVYAEQNLYTCSADTQERIKKMIKEHNLNRVIVASCTPRTHEPLFRNTCREAGLNPYLFEMANIRDQCSWVHMQLPEEATVKAKDLVRMAVAKAHLLEPLRTVAIPVKKSALVLGGGLAGMTAALEFAAQGFPVHLVEKEKVLGGHLRRIRHEIGEHDVKELADELAQRLHENKLVTLHTSTTLSELSGYIGNFVSKLTDGTSIEHGVIVVATGAQEYRPHEYLYGKNKHVMTQLELEELLAEGKFKVNEVIIIQCVGSRTEQNPQCSRVCCYTAAKNAIKLNELNPNCGVYVLYKDIRTYGFRENYYREAAEKGVVYIRYSDAQPPEVHEHKGKLRVTVFDQFLEDTYTLEPDIVVLNAGIESNPDNEALAKMLKVPLTREKFFLEAHMKLRPVDFATDGIFLCGLAHSPKFVDETIASACGAVARAATVLSKDFIESEAAIATVDTLKCRGCGRCEEGCEYKAPEVKLREDGRVTARINEALCKGCGKCATRCCSGAITMKHFTNKQIEKVLESVFIEEEMAHG